MATTGDATVGGTPREVHDAVGLFLRQQTEALQQDVPAARAACEALLDALAHTLPPFLDRADADAERSTRPVRLGVELPDVGVDASGEPSRRAWAAAVLRKRAAEAEGALLHLRLTLSRLDPAAPTDPAAARRRLESERRAALDALEGVRAALRLWVAAAEAAEGAAPSAPAPTPPAAELLRLARGCLHAGEAGAAALLLRHALVVGLCEPLRLAGSPHAQRASALEDVLAAWAAAGVAPRDVDLDRCREADAQLARLDPADELSAWVLLDFVERTVNMAGMTPPPARSAIRDP